MRKSIAFVSIVLTAFVLAVLVGVVHAYKGLKASGPSSRTSSASLSQPASVQVAVPTPVQSVSPQDAASLAARYLNRADLYSVELAGYNGLQTYKVTFSSGDIVYVSLNGQVVAAVPPQPTVIVSSSPGTGQGTGSSGHPGGEGEHEGGDD